MPSQHVKKGQEKEGGGGGEMRQGKEKSVSEHPVKHCPYEMSPPTCLLLRVGVSQEGKLLLIGHQITRN